MKFDAPLVATDLAAVPDAAAHIEADGFDGAYTFEGPRDPFLPLVLAAEHTTRLELMTAVAIAFARNPMTVAYTGWDLQAASGGRAIVGLGSQVKPHVERRFSMPWSAPAARMREFVLAVRAVWDCWQHGEPLQFAGEHYRHTLMTPFFTPEPSPTGPPRLYLAGVGRAMTSAAADVADGFIVHPFSTPDYVRDRLLPALRSGARGRDPRFEVAWPVMVATGATDEDRAGAELATRTQIAFYASTPAYRPVLELHGRADLQPRLQELTRAGDWTRLVELVDDDLFDLVAVRGAPTECGQELARRTRGLVDRVALNAPYHAPRAVWRDVLKAARDAADDNGDAVRRPGS